MAQTLYENLWTPKDIRTLILGILLFSMSFLLELIFIFFAIELENSIWGFLYLEFDLFGDGFTPLLTLTHLILWGVMFFSILMVYAVIREYTGGRTSVLEVIVIVAVFAIVGWLRFDLFFGILVVGISALIFGYMFLTLGE